MAGVDTDFDAHPRSQWWPAHIAVIDPHAHGNALDDLDPIAAGVLGREQREFLRRCWADALDSAPPFEVRISVHRHRDRLPALHICELGLFWISIDPDMIGR